MRVRIQSSVAHAFLMLLAQPLILCGSRPVPKAILADQLHAGMGSLVLARVKR